MVKNYRKVSRRHTHGCVTRLCKQLPDHVAKAGNGPNRQTIGFARQGRQGVIGPENITGTVNQEEMIVFFHGDRDNAAIQQGPCRSMG